MPGIPLKETVDDPWVVPKYFPLRVTVIPIVPEAGETDVIEGDGLRAKVAVTVLFAVMFTEQPLPCTEVQPFHEVRLESSAGSAVRVTVPWVKKAEQVVPHEMPLGSLATVPDPEPDSETVRLYRGPSKAKAAMTVLSESIVIEHSPVPEHAPDQPVNVDPDAGTAVRVTPIP